jgi:hypothetical protein
MNKIIRVGIIMLLLTTVLPSKAVDDGVSVFYITENVGIKERLPSATLHVNGSSLFEAGNVTFSNTSPVTFNDLALVNSILRIPTGAVAGYVLTTDATGNASWADLSVLAGAGDDLGSHIATTELNLAGNDITNVNVITANVFNGGIFKGDGSGLSGVSASNGVINNTTINQGNINNSTINNSTINNPVLNTAFLQDPTINGIATFTENSKAVFKGDVQILEGAGAGKVLASDRNGNVTWMLSTNIPSNGDDLGNHTAARELNMATFDISDVGTITADNFEGGTFNGRFVGDGSGLRGLNNIFTLAGNAITNNGAQASFGNDFVIGSKTLDYSGESNRMFFDKLKAAFRAGSTSSTDAEWNTANIGTGSAAFGYNNMAKGNYSTAFGLDNQAIGGYSTAWGQNTKALGAQSTTWGATNSANGTAATAWGQNSRAIGAYSTAWGITNRSEGVSSTAFGGFSTATGNYSTAIGYDANSQDARSIAIGNNVTSMGSYNIAIGRGNSKTDRLENSIANSLAIGFRSNASTLFVGPGIGGATKGKVGIGTNTPQDLLDVSGKLRTQAFRMTTGAANDFVLSSDGLGNATWKAISSISGSGDNLGDHKATQTLDMNNQDISNIKYLTANNILTHNTTPGSFGTRLYAQIPQSGGYADFVTVSRQTPASPLKTKWATGSTGDTRDNGHGGSNTYYIFQHTDKNDANVNGYRLAITDDGFVGIGLPLANAKLDVGGGTKNYIDGVDDILVKDDIEVDGTIFTSAFRMPTGAANNLILSSDAAGNATWRSIAAIGGTGDNLGNHLATQNLNMATKNIINVGSITATSFSGPGAGITNLNADNLQAGTVNINRLPNLPASKTTTGVFDVARIPNLPASKTTTGVFDVARIPNLPASKIIGGGADNLGNHTATQNLNMANNNIVNTGTMSAADINLSNRLTASSLRMTTGAGAGKVLTSNSSGIATWQSPSSAADNLGNHTATLDLQMANKKILNANKIVIGPTQGLGSLYVENPNAGTKNTQAFVAIKEQDGWAEFGTVDKTSNKIKWEFGSTGDTRGSGFGGPNSFYIHQKNNKNDVEINEYRLHITDTGNVSIGGTNATEKLEVEGKVKAECIILGDGTEICDKNNLGNEWKLVHSEDFNTTPTNWNDNTTTTCAGHKILGGYGIAGNNKSFTKNFDLSAYSHTHVKVKFNYYSLDTWDDEAAILRIDGFPTWTENRVHFLTQGREVFANCGSGGYSGYKDRVLQGNAFIEHTANSVNLNFTSTLNEGPTNESFGIDNLEIWVKKQTGQVLPEPPAPPGPSDNASCGRDGFYEITSGVTNGGSNETYGHGASTADFTKCNKLLYNDGGHSLTRTWSFTNPPRSGAVILRTVHNRTGETYGNTYYWFNNTNISLNVGQSVHDGTGGVTTTEYRCNYDKPTNKYTCTHHLI